MKNIAFIISITVTFLLVGCVGQLTPSQTVEELLNKYIKNDTEIMKELDTYIENQDLNPKQKEVYKEVLQDEYSSMKYTIKKETINGSKAKVLAKLKVKNLYKIEKEAIEYLHNNPKEFLTEGKFNQNKFLNYKLEQMQNRTDKISYIINVNMTKKNNIWFINRLSDETVKKIHGLYEN